MERARISRFQQAIRCEQPQFAAADLLCIRRMDRINGRVNAQLFFFSA
jgi:hypothetical protein